MWSGICETPAGPPEPEPWPWRSRGPVSDDSSGPLSGRFPRDSCGLQCPCTNRKLLTFARPDGRSLAAGSVFDRGSNAEGGFERLRKEWPGLEILLRAECAYACEELLAWCEDNGVDYVRRWRESTASRSTPSRRRSGLWRGGIRTWGMRGVTLSSERHGSRPCCDPARHARSSARTVRSPAPARRWRAVGYGRRRRPRRRMRPRLDRPGGRQP